MASLAEISRICGVSLGATSKALSGKPGVSEATRQRVLSVAAQRNYRPNRLVHAIQRGRSMTVGLTCGDFHGDFGGRIVEGMLQVLYQAHYDPLVINWDLCVHEGEKVLRTFAERRVDGLLMFPPADQPSQDYLLELKNMRRPIVVIDQVFAGCECYDFVGSQDAEGAGAATEHLLSLGHRRVANIFHRQTSTGRARLEGFQQAMARAGVAIHDRWLCEITEHESAQAYEKTRALLSARERPTAILCFNDWVALDVIAAATDLGLSVPRDVSVVGFADLQMAAKLRPRLTTVAQDPREIGRRAAARLVALLEASAGAPDVKNIGEAAALAQAAAPRAERVPVRLEVRDSTAAPTA